jgi:rSAM/selenodomain-associated transferase 1
MSARNSGAALGIMARYPRAGDTKTRLAADIGAQQAADFYSICARLIFSEMRNVPVQINKFIFFTGNSNWDRVSQWTGEGFDLLPQVGTDLGKRLANSFSQLFSSGIKSAVLLASDVPDISMAVIDEAFSALESKDVVLGPAHDGGYYLIGMNRLSRALFSGIHWGSAEVLEDTLARVLESNLSFYLLPTLIDIDSIADLRLWLAMGGTKAVELREYVRGSNPDLFCHAVDYQI